VRGHSGKLFPSVCYTARLAINAGSTWKWQGVKQFFEVREGGILSLRTASR
jgi:hypothetical protein